MAACNVEDVKEVLNDVRANIDERFSEWFMEAEELAKTVDVTPSIPRRCGRQTQRENCPAETPRNTQSSNDFQDDKNISKVCLAAYFENTSYCFWFYVHQLASFFLTSCKCERLNSELSLLKTYLRTTMGQSRQNGLALMHVHYSLELNMKKIIDSFARKHLRRMMYHRCDTLYIKRHLK
jgi:hypothetical protein